MRLLIPAVAALVLGPLLAPPAFAGQPSPANAGEVRKVADAARQSGTIAWMLAATALAMLMVPGLALFYGGMVRRKNTLGTMMHPMIALGLVGVQWVVVGYALAFGSSTGGFHGWDPELVLLGPAVAGVTFPGTDCPVYLHAMFHGMLAVVAVSLISGAFAERVKFGAFCVFALLWTTLVYDLLAHWVWAVNWRPNADGTASPAGWLGKMGVLDFAGGTVVHVAAGVSGLAAVLMLRKRHGYPDHAMHPNSLVLTLFGAGLLWFGWFGCNAGGATAGNAQAASALAATQAAAAAGGLAWVLVEWSHRGKPTALGFASGVVAGLVAVTPASGFVAPGGALVVGALAGTLCYAAVLLKPLFGYDDSLDAFGIHGLGGFLGAILTGLLVSVPLWRTGTGAGDGVFPGAMKDGVGAQVLVQLVAAGTAAVYSFVVTALLVLAIDKTMGFTVSGAQEAEGLDRTIHGEVGFDPGGALLDMATNLASEPRPARESEEEVEDVRFTLVVEGPDADELRRAWARLCDPKSGPPSREFRAVYRFFTTICGHKFRFRGGNHITLKENLQTVLQEAMDGTAVKVHSDV